VARQILEIAGFLEKCAELISAEVPLLKAMEIATREVPDQELSLVFNEMRLKMESGQGVTDTFREYPHLFTTLSLAIIEMGEANGHLEDGFQRVAWALKKIEKDLPGEKPAQEAPLSVEAKSPAQTLPSMAVLVHPVKESARQLAEINKSLMEINNHLAKLTQQMDEIMKQQSSGQPSTRNKTQNE